MAAKIDLSNPFRLGEEGFVLNFQQDEGLGGNGRFLGIYCGQTYYEGTTNGFLSREGCCWKVSLIS